MKRGLDGSVPRATSQRAVAKGLDVVKVGNNLIQMFLQEYTWLQAFYKFLRTSRGDGFVRGFGAHGCGHGRVVVVQDSQHPSYAKVQLVRAVVSFKGGPTLGAFHKHVFTACAYSIPWPVLDHSLDFTHVYFP